MCFGNVNDWETDQKIYKSYKYFKGIKGQNFV